VQDKFLAKDYQGAMAALPVDFLDATSLLGTTERIADRMQALAQAGVTTLTITPMLQDLEQGIAGLRTAVEALDLAGVGS
jgi:alkanesulfonate monooxygenase SsuD/methylene tetrahydromethanopterin reductase-like flavin-dependent oxidoreductase (luciferase family)